jgi:hypothetical protein
MAQTLSPVPKLAFLDNNGKPAVGYKLFTYEAGSSTKLATYVDSAGGTPNANPIVLDYRGEANVWVPPNVAYKYVFAKPNDTDPPGSPVWSVDNLVNSQLITLYGGVDTGSANAYILNFVANFSSYTDGIIIYWIPSNTNTGASTINVNGLGPVAILNQDGTPLYLGQLRANQFATILYKGTGFVLVDTSLLPVINTQDNDYTFALNDANNIVENSSASDWTYTIPTNASAAFPEGSSIQVIASGDGDITITPDGGVTLNPYGVAAAGDVTIIGHASTTITKVGTNQWVQSTPSDVPSNILVAGAYAGSLTGFAAPIPSSMIVRKCGGIVSILSIAEYSGTSNSTAMTLTGLPTTFRPTVSATTVVSVGMLDNGAEKGGVAVIGTDGTITFGTGLDNNTTGFTGSGTKGLKTGWCITFNRGAS